MNSFIANNKQFFSLVLCLLLSSSLYGITINNEPLDNIIKPGEVLVLTIQKEYNCVVLEMKNGNIDIKAGSLIKEREKKTIIKTFKKNSRNPIQLNSSSILSGQDIKKNSHIIGEEINIESSFSSFFSVDLKGCFFEAPNVFITANRVNFEDCFLINPRILMLNFLHSDYETIQISFHEQTNIPFIVTGFIDFSLKNKSIQHLCLTNVKEIAIEFNAKIWNNYQSNFSL